METEASFNPESRERDQAPDTFSELVDSLYGPAKNKLYTLRKRKEISFEIDHVLILLARAMKEIKAKGPSFFEGDE